MSHPVSVNHHEAFVEVSIGLSDFFFFFFFFFCFKKKKKKAPPNLMYMSEFIKRRKINK
jgi:hypothetical protein